MLDGVRPAGGAGDDRERSWVGSFSGAWVMPLLLVGVAASAFSTSCVREWEVAAVLGVPMLLLGSPVHRWCVLLTVALLRLSYHPFLWPTYWISLVPFVWMYCHQGTDVPAVRLPSRLLRDFGPAWVIGFAAAWLNAPYLRDALPRGGILVLATTSLLFGLQFSVLAFFVRLLRHRRLTGSSILFGVIAAVLEYVQVRYGIRHNLLVLALPAAGSGISQLASHFGIFGVSGILYTVNYVLCPHRCGFCGDGWLRCVLTAAIGLGLTSWGRSIAQSPDDEMPPVRAHLVQPDSGAASQCAARFEALDQITRGALASFREAELVVWPETALGLSTWDRNQAEGDSDAPDDQTLLPLEADDLRRAMDRVRSSYRVPLLSGILLTKHKAAVSYGVPIRLTYLSNSACLIGIEMGCGIGEHSKRVLVPFRERIPPCLDLPLVRRMIENWLGHVPRLEPGQSDGVLATTRADGQPVTLGVAICYESQFPWLPQFDPSIRADAIVHLAYDGWCARFSEYAVLQQWTCQYRAVETRTWQYLCCECSGSAVVDPRGRVRGRLGRGPGVLIVGRNGRVRTWQPPAQRLSAFTIRGGWPAARVAMEKSKWHSLR